MACSCVSPACIGTRQDRATTNRRRSGLSGALNRICRSGQLLPGPFGTSIPVTIQIPLDVKPCDTGGVRDQTLWLLEAMADVPGVDYHDIFEVPVFRTRQTDAMAPAAASAPPAEPTQAAQPQTLTVEISRSAQGVEFYFPAARNKGFAFGTTVVSSDLWSRLPISCHVSHAPVIFPIAFGFFTPCCSIST